MKKTDYKGSFYLYLLKKLIPRLQSQQGSSYEEDPKYKVAKSEHTNAFAGNPNVKWIPPEVIAEDIQGLHNELLQEMKEKSQQIIGEVKQAQLDPNKQAIVASTESTIQESIAIGQILRQLSVLSGRLESNYHELIKTGKVSDLYLSLSKKLNDIYTQYTYKTGILV